MINKGIWLPSDTLTLSDMRTWLNQVQTLTAQNQALVEQVQTLTAQNQALVKQVQTLTAQNQALAARVQAFEKTIGQGPSALSLMLAIDD